MRTTSAQKRGFQNYNEYVYGLVLKSRYTVVSLEATGAFARCCESRQFAPSSRFLMRMFRSSLVGRCYVNLNQPSVSLPLSFSLNSLSLASNRHGKMHGLTRGVISPPNGRRWRETKSHQMPFSDFLLERPAKKISLE